MRLVSILVGVLVTVTLLISILGWYAVDFSWTASALLQTNSGVTWTLIALWGLVLLVSAAAAIFLYLAAVRPLLTLRRAAQQVGGGDFGVRVKVVGESEMADLAKSFNAMVARLAADSDEQRRIFATLEESERRLRIVLEAAVDGILVADAATQRVTIANRAICDMLGYSWDELSRLNVADIHPPESLAHVQEQFARQAKGELKVAASLPVRRKDGSVFYADVSTAPMTFGDRLYLVGVFHDVTERKQSDEKIRQLNEQLERKVAERTRQLVAAQEDLLRQEKLSTLGQVAGVVGHELRNPLGVMSNALYFLRTVMTGADDTLREYLDILGDEIDNADRIVSDLLDSVRTKPPNLQPVAAAELVAGSLAKCTIPDTVATRLELADHLPLLLVDPRQLQQVFVNIINNAVESMPDGGELRIDAAAADGRMDVRVRDTGCGIAPDAMQNLFKPLYTTKAKGLGLGLMVIKNLTENNGGTVTVHSTPGEGTTFTLNLPCLTPSLEEAA